MPGKIDLFKLHKNEYAAPRKPALIHTKPAPYLAIDGQGAPGGECFVACIGALYSVAFTVKMTRKFAGRQDYAIGKLECQYPQPNFCALPREQWQWRLLIRTPDFVPETDREKAVAALLKKGKPPEVTEVKLLTITEANCVQMLHLGPYDREGESMALMRQFAAAKNLSLRGPFHEIYLSDPRRVPPARLKTILRAPVSEPCLRLGLA